VKDFSGWDDFISWKESEEESSHCHFNLQRKLAVLQVYRLMIFGKYLWYCTILYCIIDERCTVVCTCCRDRGYRGCNKQQKKDIKRNPEIITRKVLSSINSIEDLQTGNVTATYTSTHNLRMQTNIFRYLRAQPRRL